MTLRRRKVTGLASWVLEERALTEFWDLKRERWRGGLGLKFLLWVNTTQSPLPSTHNVRTTNVGIQTHGLSKTRNSLDPIPKILTSASRRSLPLARFELRSRDKSSRRVRRMCSSMRRCWGRGIIWLARRWSGSIWVRVRRRVTVLTRAWLSMLLGFGLNVSVVWVEGLRDETCANIEQLLQPHG